MTNHSAEFYVVQRHTIHTDVADNDALMEVIDEVTQDGDSMRTTVHEKDVPLRFIADGGEDEDGPFMTAFPTDYDPWTPRALRELAQWCLTRANEKDGRASFVEGADHE